MINYGAFAHGIFQLIDNVLTLWGIRHSVASAYHPQSNGQDESTNKTVKRALAKYTIE